MLCFPSIDSVLQLGDQIEVGFAVCFPSLGPTVGNQVGSFVGSSKRLKIFDLLVV